MPDSTRTERRTAWFRFSMMHTITGADSPPHITRLARLRRREKYDTHRSTAERGRQLTSDAIDPPLSGVRRHPETDLIDSDEAGGKTREKGLGRALLRYRNQ